MTELLLRPLADAFMQVGVFVALLIVPFGWARFRYGGRLDSALLRHARWGPAVAAAMTIPPGCGGAILVMAIYARGGASFGCAIAALVATMGDASWVLLAADPVLTAELRAVMFVTGTVTGYAVDALGISPRRRTTPLFGGALVAVPAESSGRAATASSMRTGSTAPTVAGSAASLCCRTPATSSDKRPALRADGSLTGSLTGRLSTPGVPGGVGGFTLPIPMLQNVGLLTALLWLVVATGMTVSMPVTFQVVDPAALAPLFGGVDPYLALGVVGTALCAVKFCMGNCRLADDNLENANPSSMSEVLRQGGREVAFLTVWVACAYIAWSVTMTLTGFDGSQLPLFGILGVLVGTLVGLIPGCAIQIVFAGIFLAGGMPLPTLLANSLSQDGDALLPLLALERRSALVATVLTTLPALVVGAAALLLT